MSPIPIKTFLEVPWLSLATIGPDGRPQLTEVWFLYDEVRSRSHSIRVGRRRRIWSLVRSARYCILDLDVPQRYLELRGDVEVTADDGSFVEKVGKKYSADLRAYDQPGDERVVVRIVPKKINAVDMRG